MTEVDISLNEKELLGNATVHYVCCQDRYLSCCGANVVGKDAGQGNATTCAECIEFDYNNPPTNCFLERKCQINGDIYPKKEFS